MFPYLTLKSLFVVPGTPLPKNGVNWFKSGVKRQLHTRPLLRNNPWVRVIIMQKGKVKEKGMYSSVFFN